MYVCVCWGLGRGAAGLETAVVGGVNPTHYNSSLWPVLGKGLQGPTVVSYQYVFLLFHLSKWPLTARWLGSFFHCLCGLCLNISLFLIPSRSFLTKTKFVYTPWLFSLWNLCCFCVFTSISCQSPLTKQDLGRIPVMTNTKSYIN